MTRMVCTSALTGCVALFPPDLLLVAVVSALGSGPPGYGLGQPLGTRATSVRPWSHQTDESPEA